MRFDRGVIGILFCGIVTTWAKKVPLTDGTSAAYSWRWVRRLLMTDDCSPQLSGFDGAEIASAVELLLFESPEETERRIGA